MRPGVDIYLDELSRLLGQDIAPKLATSFDQTALMRNSMLLTVVIDEFDKAAARRIEENQAIRRLFARAVGVLPTSDLQSRLLAAAQSEEAGFRVGDLDKSNCALRALLIELHERVEDVGDAALDRAILALYVRMAEGRRLQLGG